MDSRFEQARELFLQGVAHHEAGRPAQAETALLASLALLPGRASTLMNLGAARLALGRPAEALEVLEQSLAAEPQSALSRCHQAAALVALQRPQEALQAYEAALQIEPGLAAARFHRAQVLATLQRHDDALAALEPLLDEDDERSAPAWLCAGQALQALGRHAHALQPYRHALTLDPQLPRAAALLGQLLQTLGRPEEARAVHAEAVSRGVDTDLNRYLLAGLGGGAAPALSPVAYVRALFDPYAQGFDEHLVQQLRYQGHVAVVQAARAAAVQPSEAPDPATPLWPAVLDLGCGTGLCGRLVRPHTGHLSGVDLSPTMIATAQAQGGYDTLHQADVADHLHQTEARFDLLLAADLFIYIGALERVMAGARRVLRPGGHFCLTIETPLPGEAAPAGFCLRPSLRYAQEPAYVSACAAQEGLLTLSCQPLVLREEERLPIAGMVITLRA
ncbi:MAG: tetratricopeptide repeat protein [Rubrivivax sp.]|nr:tetratricopeptide repeat protein [Rubrivivax sp.]